MTSSAKPPRIAVCIATSGNCKTQFAMSLASLMAYFPSRALMTEQPEQYIAHFLAESSSLASNQHKLVLAAREWQATHILWVEDDMAFPPDSLHRLFAWRQMWVGANYPIRTGPPFDNTAVGLDGKRVQTTQASSGLESVAYTGYGVTLMDIGIFDRIELPYFEMCWHPDGHYVTSDWYLSEKVRGAGIQVYVDHDLSKQIGHAGAHVYHVAEVEAWKNAQEQQNGK